MSIQAAIALNVVIGVAVIGSLLWLLAQPGIAAGGRHERPLLRRRLRLLQRHAKHEADSPVR